MSTSSVVPRVHWERVNGVRIAYADARQGDPLVLVHGSWGSHHNWDPVVPGLAEHFRVVSYDRRGHSDSERPSGQGHFSEDVADLAALIEAAGLAPAWVVGNSAGAVITLQARGRLGPSSCAGSSCTSRRSRRQPRRRHCGRESGPRPSGRRIAAGDHAGAAEQFVDQVALGPGSWARCRTRCAR